jgi:hypothetical protein
LGLAARARVRRWGRAGEGRARWVRVWVMREWCLLF